MPRFVRSNGAVLAMLLILSGLSFAQNDGTTPGKPAEPPAGKKTEPVPAPDGPRDPTKPSPKLKDALDNSKTASGTAAPRIPNITLRGRVLAKGKPPTAIIELDPKQAPHTVIKGSKITVGNLTLSVTEVSSSEVRIEVSPLNEVIILR